MNRFILDLQVQDYIKANLNADVSKIAMAKSPFDKVSSQELANQIAAKKKSVKKLPLWFNTDLIYYPPLISIEQCSSELTAIYKSALAEGNTLIDLTGGLGIDSYYFAKKIREVTHCEINSELSEIARYNSGILKQDNIAFEAGDGLTYLQKTNRTFHTIFIDPARRGNAGKVFMLKDCTPNVVEHMDLLLEKSNKIIIKTSPLLDITAGLKELKNVTELHIVSTKNECKELLFVVEKNLKTEVKIVSTTLNDKLKQFTFLKGEEMVPKHLTYHHLLKYLYEPDVALLKSGAFDLIAWRYNLLKLNDQTQLYTSNIENSYFPGRIFEVEQIISMRDLKKESSLTGNVIVRSFPQKAEHLIKKYKIKSDNKRFLIFTNTKSEGFIIIKATIIQHY